ncbi:hypothetical protein AB0M45_05935 [Nocardia sp. NPDC051787]|uniref:hypothetical protein n=1 Tax=Nocardia sp. NPDC051787 TaxID=3155415 RepID=UPI0034249BFE
MTTALSDRHIPRELEPAAEHLFNDYLHNPKTRNPHDYAQWDDRCEFTGWAALSGSLVDTNFPTVSRPR